MHAIMSLYVLTYVGMFPTLEVEPALEGSSKTGIRVHHHLHGKQGPGQPVNQEIQGDIETGGYLLDDNLYEFPHVYVLCC